MIKEQLLNALPMLTEVEHPNIVSFEVDRDQFIEAVTGLANLCAYNALIDLTVVEYPEDMAGVYHLMNMEDMDMICVTVRFSKEDLWLPSLTDIFNAANVMEREAYDFFGVDYKGHPNLTRILCPDDFVGFPLRKDYKSFVR